MNNETNGRYDFGFTPGLFGEWGMKEAERYIAEVAKGDKKCEEAAIYAVKAALDARRYENTMSIPIFLDCFTRLMAGIPLTELTGEDDMWEWNTEGDMAYHKRYAALAKFRRPGTLGKLTERVVDQERYYCVDVSDNIKGKFYGGIGASILNELFPVEFPYRVPLEKFAVFVDNEKPDEETGIFTLVGVEAIRKPSGVIIKVNKYFKYVDGCYQQIPYDQFEKEVGR